MNEARTTFAFIYSGTEDAKDAATRLARLYGQSDIAEADVVVALGGDGFLLQTLRETMSTGKKVYGMNRGTVGFLMNEYNRREPSGTYCRCCRRDDPPAGDGNGYLRWAYLVRRGDQ